MVRIEGEKWLVDLGDFYEYIKRESMGGSGISPEGIQLFGKLQRFYIQTKSNLSHLLHTPQDPRSRIVIEKLDVALC